MSGLLTMPKPLTVWITIKCKKLLKEMGIPDHLTCLVRNLYAGQEATVGTVDYAKAFDCMDHNILWKLLQEMEIPDHLTCFLKNLYAGQEATVGTDLEQQTGSK